MVVCSSYFMYYTKMSLVITLSLCEVDHSYVFNVIPYIYATAINLGVLCTLMIKVPTTHVLW